MLGYFIDRHYKQISKKIFIKTDAVTTHMARSLLSNLTDYLHEDHIVTSQSVGAT